MLGKCDLCGRDAVPVVQTGEAEVKSTCADGYGCVSYLARAAALEEAATLCDAYAAAFERPGAVFEAARDAARSLAADIRLLAKS